MNIKTRSYFLSAGLTLILFLNCTTTKKQFDILIENGTVYNGVDTVASYYSIGIKRDSIVFIGNSKNIDFKAKKIIDATGMIVCPGFIDPHTHADKDLINSDTSSNLPFLMQGITTVVIGNDGNSLFPSKDIRKKMEKIGVGTNVVQLTGHGTLRKKAMGDSDRRPTSDELKTMKKLVVEEMKSGTFGMSTGLFYKPGNYAKTQEIIELAKVVSEYDGIYDTHLRDESTFSVGLIEAVNEALQIGENAEIPIHISHIKCLGVDVWHKSETVIKLIEEAQKQGLKISANQYPYEASATGLQSAVIPRWAESGGKDSLYVRYKDPKFTESILTETEKNITRRGGPEKLLLVRAEDSSLVGKNLLQVSKMYDLSSAATVLEILKKNNIKVASFNMHETDIQNFMKKDWVVTGSDGGSGHPRKYGTFPRKYRKYAIEDKTISIHHFINNSTSKTAEILKLPKRGKIVKDYIADVIIFDPNIFKDIANYTEAYNYAKGLHYAIINGQISVAEGNFTKKLNGKVLHK